MEREGYKMIVNYSKVQATEYLNVTCPILHELA
jgi:hypothetical protein